MRKILNEVIKVCGKYYMFSNMEKTISDIKRDFEKLELPVSYHSNKLFYKPNEGNDILICEIYPMEFSEFKQNLIKVIVPRNIIFSCEKKTKKQKQNVPKMYLNEKAWDDIKWFILENGMLPPNYIVEKMGFEIIGKTGQFEYFYRDMFGNILVNHGTWYGICPENIFLSVGTK